MCLFQSAELWRNLTTRLVITGGKHLVRPRAGGGGGGGVEKEIGKGSEEGSPLFPAIWSSLWPGAWKLVNTCRAKGLK